MIKRASVEQTLNAVGIRRRLRVVANGLAPPHTLRRSAGRAALVVARSTRDAARGFATDWRSGSPRPLFVPSAISLPVSDAPVVSIIIPVHNQWARTRTCLWSIAAGHYSAKFEVIVVDDASTDRTPRALSSIDGAISVHLDENVGFLKAVNAGLQCARGAYVVLLNNDTIVREGWLDALVATADSDPTVGVVGAKLVYPNGRLQEAGGIIWQEGTGFNYGRGDSPDDARYSFMRDVDYCSGACILVRRELLTKIGGVLDATFSPAYYEDTDLCFAARECGYRVVYQPRAVVVHHEGASHGMNTTSGMKRFQEINRAKFVEKWSDAVKLLDEPSPAQVRRSSWRAPNGRCLVIDLGVPTPDKDSGSRRMSELLDILTALGFAVTFFAHTGPEFPTYRQALMDRGIEVLRAPIDLEEYVKAVSPDLRLVLLSRPTNAWAYYPMLRLLSPQAALVYDTVDLHFLRERGFASTHDDENAAKRATHLLDMEQTLCCLADQVWTVSQTEADALAEINRSIQAQVVPNIHRATPTGPPFEAREGLLFVGSYAHAPNSDAVKWFVSTILPLVRDQLPGVSLTLVGSDVTSEIESLTGDGIVVRGWVPELDELYHQSRAFVAPLRFGAGMKGKVGEACSFGLPVVTTSVGAEGMGFEDGKDVLIRDDPSGFARAIVDVYTDSALWNTLGRNGCHLVERDLSPEAVQARVARALRRLDLRLQPR